MLTPRKRNRLLVASAVGAGVITSCSSFHGVVFEDDGGSDASDAATPLSDVLLGFAEASPPADAAPPQDAAADAPSE